MVLRIGGCEPILCAPLLRKVDGKLIELLGTLGAEDWDLQTLAREWKVRDVAAHLLDTVLRKLSLVRDSWFVEKVELRSAQDVVDFVNRVNREGVAIYRRLSPPALIDMMTLACEQSATFHEALDPFAQAAFNVSWAGEETSLNWFDTARELTERWHHQQQIRLATARAGIMTPELYFPVLDCFARGLPYSFRDVHRREGTTLELEILGECGGRWWLSRGAESWRFVGSASREPDARIAIPEEIA